VSDGGFSEFRRQLDCDRVLVERSRTPFCDGARALLAEGLAEPSNVLTTTRSTSRCGTPDVAACVPPAETVPAHAGRGAHARNGLGRILA
jgi:hypothetical protein